MKVIFLLDNNEYAEVAPERLQIRQIAAGVAALGTEVTVPLKKEDGSPDLDYKGVQKTQPGFRPFINYNVNLSIPQPEKAEPVEVRAEAPKAAKGAGRKRSAAARRKS
jgi:hypothetical protein